MILKKCLDSAVFSQGTKGFSVKVLGLCARNGPDVELTGGDNVHNISEYS
jgi:hypothetical protein